MSSQTFETTLQQHYQQVAGMTSETYKKNLFTLELASVYEMSQNKENSLDNQTIATSVLYDMLSTTAGYMYLKSDKNLTVAFEAKAKAFMVKTLDEPYEPGSVEKLVNSIAYFADTIEPVFKHHKITYNIYHNCENYWKTFKGKNKDKPIDVSILVDNLKEEIRRETKQCLYDTKLVCKD
ncbi:hypothetical protein EBU95_20570, partial [bacterium]|nr:hypothetical protein [bacterium]